MAFTLLGNNPVNFGDGWVLYDPIALQAGRTYLMELQIFSANPDLIYSSFKIRYAYPTQNTAVASNLNTQEAFYEPVRQYFIFSISPLALLSGNAIFAVRRFPIFSSPSSLADATVALAIDPDLFE